MAEIDIAMATCEGARFLPAQLDSIAGQSFGGWHLLVRDDGSSDGTRDILARFAERHPGRVTPIEDGAGRLGARGNFARAMAASRAPYLAFSDQDDLWRPEKLARALAAMRAAEAAAPAGTPVMVHADRRLVDAAGREIAPSYWASRGLDAAGFGFGTCLGFCLAAGSAMLVNRPLLGLAGELPDAARMHDTWLELVAHAFGRVVVLEEVALDFRRHGGNASGGAAAVDVSRARRPMARAARLLRNLGRQRRITAGYLAQARAFRARFGERLDAETLRRLDLFLSLPCRRLPGRALALARSRTGPPGLARGAVFAALARE